MLPCLTVSPGQSLSIVPRPAQASESRTRNVRRAIRIVIAEEQTISRQGLQALLHSKAGFKVVGGVDNGNDPAAVVRKSKADLLLLDISSSPAVGLAQLRKIVQSDAAIRVLILAPPLSKSLIIQAMGLGARGVVYKTSTSELLLEAITRVGRGDYWLPNETLASLIEAVQQTFPRKEVQSKFGLTARENEMVLAVLDGLSNQEIAEKLGLSEQTVKNHLSHVFDKLGVYSRLELALFAVNHQIAIRPEQ